MSTKIEWATETWNPITGCTKVSEGCKNCYAERMSKRLAGRYGYPKDNPFKPTFHPCRLDQPLKWKKPRMVFVCSMGDIFHPAISLFDVEKVFDIINDCDPQRKDGVDHKFLILTKRPKRMKAFFEMQEWRIALNSNIWLGVTAENQQRFDERWPVLNQIPAAINFISVEPMLSDIDMEVVPCRYCNHPGDILKWPCPHCKGRRFEWPDWVVCGGETGTGAREMKNIWPVSLKEQCTGSGVPFFFKKWGNDKRRDIGGKLHEQYPT